jgi:hypothetical protein
MSIIHDALKKVQEKTAPQPPFSSPLNPITSPNTDPTPPRQTSRPTLPWLLLSIIISIPLAISAFFLLWPHLNATTKKTIPASALSSPVATPAPVAVPMTATAPDTQSALRIEGVMDMGDGKKVALINGNIYEKGQSIQGKTISRITLEEITVINNGVEQVLPVTPGKQ